MVVEWLVAVASAGPAEIERMAACHGGDAESCWVVGKALGDAGIRPRVARLLATACAGGVGEACGELASGAKGPDAARNAGRACERGYAAACPRALADPLLPLGVRLALAEQRCEAGDADACALPARLGLTDDAVESWLAVPGVEQGRSTPGGRVVARSSRVGPGVVDRGPATDLVYLDPRAGVRMQVRWLVPEEELGGLTLADPGRRWAEQVAGQVLGPFLTERGHVGLGAPRGIGSLAAECSLWVADGWKVQAVPTAGGDCRQLGVASDGRAVRAGSAGRWHMVLADGSVERTFAAREARFAADGTLIRQRRGTWQAWRDGGWVALGASVVDQWGSRQLVFEDGRAAVVDDGREIWSIEGVSEARLLPGGDLWLGDVWVGLSGSERLPAVVDPSGWVDRTAEHVRAATATLSSGRVFRVSGTVRDADGAPVEGALVRVAYGVVPTPHQPWTERPAQSLEVRADAEGRFEATIAEEKVSIAVVGPDGHRGSWGRLTVNRDLLGLQLRFGPARATVRVTDRDGAPQSDVGVRYGEVVSATSSGGQAEIPLGTWAVERAPVAWDRRRSVAVRLELWRAEAVGDGWLHHPVEQPRAELVLPLRDGVPVPGDRQVLLPVKAVDTCGVPLPGLLLDGWPTDADGWVWFPREWRGEVGALPSEGFFRMERAQGPPMWPDNHRWTGEAYEIRYPAARVTVQGEPGAEALWVGPDVRFGVAVGEEAYLTPGRWELWSTAPGVGMTLVDVRPCEVRDVPLPEPTFGVRGPLTIRLVDELGYPLPDAPVALDVLPEGFPSTGDAPLEARTDARGEARFDSVVHGLRAIRSSAGDRRGLGVIRTDAGRVAELTVAVLQKLPFQLWAHPDGIGVGKVPADHALRFGDVVLQVGDVPLRGVSLFTGRLLLRQASTAVLRVRSRTGEVRDLSPDLWR